MEFGMREVLPVPELGHDCFFPNPFQLIIHHIIWCRVPESIVKYTIKNKNGGEQNIV